MGKGSGNCARSAMSLNGGMADGETAWTRLLERIDEAPGQLHGVHCRGFADDVLYFQRVPHRERVTVTRTKLNHLGSSVWCEPDLDPETLAAWRRQYRRIHRHPVEHEGRIDEDDVRGHIERVAPMVAELEEPIMSALVRRCLKHVKRTRTVREWRTLGAVDRAMADVARGEEVRIIERLVTAGAELVDNDVEFPTYDSVHTLSSGHCYRLPGDPTVTYVPHGLPGTEPASTYRHRAEFALDDGQCDRLAESVRARARDAALDPLTSVVLVVKRPGQQTVRQVVRWPLDVKHYTGEQYEMQELRELAERSSVLRDDEEMRLILRRPTGIGELVAQRGRHGVPIETPEGWLMPMDADRRSSALTRIDRLRGLSLRRTVEWTSSEPEAPTSNDEAYALFGSDDEEHHFVDASCRNAFRMYRALAEAIADEPLADEVRDSLVRGAWAPFEHASEEDVRHVPRAQSAPLSEQGVLRVDGSPERALERLRELGLIDEVDARPERVYDDGRVRGRMLPRSTELAEPLRHPALRDRMVVHGMTGVSDPREALRRLDAIHAGGGLKSISERRRMSVGVESLSPIGDIASGIDVGVPCTVADRPAYGKYLVFAMRPEVLSRRDLFFSDTDFGGGQNRYRSYFDYARRIGQLHPYAPPSRDARERHLTEGIKSIDNEVYLRHEIPWTDVDTVYVLDDDGLPDQVRERFTRWYSDGSAPPIRVVSYPSEDYDTNPLSKLVVERARELYFATTDTGR